MDWLFTIPVFVKVGLIFVAILSAYLLGMNLGIAMVVFSAILALWAGGGPGGILWIVQSVLAPSGYLLLAVILLLLFFTESLKHTGRMEKTVDALKQWMTNRRMLFSGLPALVGLLPMPGGALFSAPLVDSVDSEKSLTPSHKVAINYWFRHIWEYWWPLYPGVILAMRYADLPAGVFFLIQIPFTVASIAGGYFFILRRIRISVPAPRSASILDFRAALLTIGPIGMLVLLSVAGSLLLPFAGIPGSLANYYSMLAGLFIALVLVFKGNVKAFSKALGMFRSKSTWTLMMVVAGVLAFSSVLQLPLDNSETIVTKMRDEFIAYGIPILAVVMLIPFISGMVTGIAVGFVGASFPLVFALIGTNAPVNVLIATTSFAYAFGYIGMILSPVHICYVVSNEYFKTRLFQPYRYIVGPALVVTVSALVICGAYYLLLRPVM